MGVESAQGTGESFDKQCMKLSNKNKKRTSKLKMQDNRG
jgi:hypothetical protein